MFSEADILRRTDAPNVYLAAAQGGKSATSSVSQQYVSIASSLAGSEQGSVAGNVEGSEVSSELYQKAPSVQESLNTSLDEIVPPEFLYFQERENLLNNEPQIFTDNLRNTYTCSNNIDNISSGALFQLQDVIEGKSTYNQIDSNIEFTVKFVNQLGLNNSNEGILLEKKKIRHF